MPDADFADLLARWTPHLRKITSRAARRIGYEPDDLFQTVALEARREFERFDPAAIGFAGWLTQLTRTAVSRAIRNRNARSRRGHAAHPDANGEEPWSPTDYRERQPDLEAARRERLDRLRHVLNQLPEDERASIIHRFELDGGTAHWLDTDPHIVESGLARLRKLLTD